MNSTKKRKIKEPVETIAQQAPCKEPCSKACPRPPAWANKIALGISLAMLLGWIVFLAVLAMSK